MYLTEHVQRKLTCKASRHVITKKDRKFGTLHAFLHTISRGFSKASQQQKEVGASSNSPYHYVLFLQ